jgi:hypothetical protein
MPLRDLCGIGICSRLAPAANVRFARVATISTALSEADQLEATNEAIQEIMKYNLTGNYQVVEREVS